MVNATQVQLYVVIELIFKDAFVLFMIVIGYLMFVILSGNNIGGNNFGNSVGNNNLDVGNPIQLMLEEKAFFGWSAMVSRSNAHFYKCSVTCISLVYATQAPKLHNCKFQHCFQFAIVLINFEFFDVTFFFQKIQIMNNGCGKK